MKVITNTGSIPLLVDYSLWWHHLPVTWFVAIMFRSFGFAPKDNFEVICLSNLLTLSISDDGYSRNTVCALNYISVVLLSKGRYFRWWTISPGGYHLPSRFIRYIYYWNLQFLNNVIKIKTKILLLQSRVTSSELDYLVQALWFSCSQHFKIIWLSNYFTMSIPKEGYARNELWQVY